MNRRQQEVIEYLKEENRVLREHIGGKRLLLTDKQKRRLATAAIQLSGDLLRQFGTFFSPDTLRKWHRLPIARELESRVERKHDPKLPRTRISRAPVSPMAVRMGDGTTPQRARNTAGSWGGSMPQPDHG